MKVFGLTCGRKMGNSEIAVKEALMGAQEAGAEVEIMRLMDLDIKPCRGCEGCTAKIAKGEPAECVIKDDDMPFFMEKFSQFDGLIIGAPVYFMSPPGYLKVLGDRMISRELNVTIQASKEGEKKRPAGLISVGGGNDNWVPMGLSLMKTLTFTEFVVVDELQVTDAGRPGQILLYEDTLKKARTLGRRVAEAVNKPSETLQFEGEDPGLCPICNSNMLVAGDRWSPAECPICGAKGSLKLEGEKVRLILDEKHLKSNRASLEGRLKHFMEIKETAEKFYARKEEVDAKMMRYKDYLSYTLPPSKSK